MPFAPSTTNVAGFAPLLYSTLIHPAVRIPSDILRSSILPVWYASPLGNSDVSTYLPPIPHTPLKARLTVEAPPEAPASVLSTPLMYILLFAGVLVSNTQAK